MLQYESSPLNEVQRWSEVPQDKPLFESIVVFENFPMDGARSFKDRGLNFVNTDFVIRNNFPLTLRVVPGSQLLLKILYDASRFDADGIAGMLAQLETLLRKIIAQPDCALAELVETLAEADRRRRSMKEEEFKATRLQKLQSVKRKAMGSAQSGGGSEG
jgi:non-ribosomal peptide synthetase component F